MEVGGVGWLGWASHSSTTSKIPDLNELPNQADKLRHKKSGLLLQSQGFTAQLTACTIYNLQHHTNKTYQTTRPTDIAGMEGIMYESGILEAEGQRQG